LIAGWPCAAAAQSVALATQAAVEAAELQRRRAAENETDMSFPRRFSAVMLRSTAARQSPRCDAVRASIVLLPRRCPLGYGNVAAVTRFLRRVRLAMATNFTLIFSPCASRYGDKFHADLFAVRVSLWRQVACEKFAANIALDFAGETASAVCAKAADWRST
jgi:hypothetical protein